MSDRNYWLKNGILNILPSISGILFSFVTFYMLIRMLSKEEYGVWIIFNSIITIIELSKNGLTQEATIKYLSAANADTKQVISFNALLINLCSAVLVSVLCLLLSSFAGTIWHSAELPLMINLYIVVFFISGIVSQINCIEQAHFQFKGVSTATLVRQLLPFCYIGYCFLNNVPITPVHLTVMNIITIIIAAVVAYRMTAKYIKLKRKADSGWIRKILNFGKYSFGISLSSTLAGSVDQMMLGSMLSKAASGAYNVAVRVTSITDIPVNSMATLVFPKSSKRFEEEGNEAIKYLYEKSVGVTLAILFPALILMYSFSEYILVFIASGKYENAAPLLRVTLLGCLLSPYGRQTGIVLASSGKTKINFYLMLLSTALIIILNLFFIKLWGVMGAAYATLLAAFISFVVAQVLLKRLFNINFRNPWIYAFKFYPEFYRHYLFRKKKA